MDNEPRVCPHCGHVSTDTDPVVWHQVYIGGRGYVPKLECANRISCWRRWDAAHGWPSWDEQVRRSEAEEAAYRQRNS